MHNGTTEEITVNGDMTIVYTNTRSRQPVRILKTNEGSTPLVNAVFSLYTQQEYAKAEGERTALQSKLRSGDGTTITLGEIDLGELEIGQYYLVETEAPAGYILLDKPVVINVERSRVVATLGLDSSTNLAEWKEEGEYWQITVHNTPGVQLPSTGGPGTKLIYIFGVLLTGLAGVGFVLRRRRRTN